MHPVSRHMVTGNDAGHTMTMPCSTHARLHARPAPRTPGSMHARLHARPAPCTPASTHARLHARPAPCTRSWPKRMSASPQLSSRNSPPHSCPAHRISSVIAVPLPSFRPSHAPQNPFGRKEQDRGCTARARAGCPSTRVPPPAARGGGVEGDCMGQGRHRLVRLASRLLLLLILGVCSFARVCVRVYADCVCVCVCVCRDCWCRVWACCGCWCN